MFSNQNFGNGLVLLVITLMALFVSPLINGFGAILVIQFITGLGAILAANYLFISKKSETVQDSIEE